MSAPAAEATALGKREQTKASNRAAILEAAREAFSELGYGATTVRDVIRRTDLASGTFYNYFPDKESVFRALLEETAREVQARARAARREAHSLEEFVGDAYRATFQFFADDPNAFALLHRNATTIRAMLGEPALMAGFDELLEDLREGIARGDIPPLDAEYTAAAMVGVALEVGVRMVEREPVDVEGATHFATTLFLGGIARLAR